MRYTLLNFEVAGSLPIFSKRFLRLSTVRLKFLMATSSNSSVGYIVSGAGLVGPNKPRPEPNRLWLEVETNGDLSKLELKRLDDEIAAF